MTVVDEGWDETLVSQLKSLGETSSVLTASPLGYELEKEVIRDADTLEKKYERKKYGTVKDALAPVRATGAVDASRAPAMTCAKTFGNSLLCHMYARRLVEVPNAPTPTLFANVDFTFADARALVRDATAGRARAVFIPGRRFESHGEIVDEWMGPLRALARAIGALLRRPTEGDVDGGPTERRRAVRGSNLTVGSVAESARNGNFSISSREDACYNSSARRTRTQRHHARNRSSSPRRTAPATRGRWNLSSNASASIFEPRPSLPPRERRWNARARLLQFARFAPDELARRFIVLDRVRSERTRVLVLARAVQRATVRVRVRHSANASWSIDTHARQLSLAAFSS